MVVTFLGAGFSAVAGAPLASKLFDAPPRVDRITRQKLVRSVQDGWLSIHTTWTGTRAVLGKSEIALRNDVESHRRGKQAQSKRRFTRGEVNPSATLILISLFRRPTTGRRR